MPKNTQTTYDLSRKQWKKNELIQLKTSEIPVIRAQLLQQNTKKVCPICNRSFKKCPPVLDHKHKRKKDKIGGVYQLGQCRGVICSYCNSVEGKLLKDLSRYGKIHDLSLKTVIEWLKNLAEYYKTPLLRYVHPTERDKKILNKSHEQRRIKRK